MPVLFTPLSATVAELHVTGDDGSVVVHQDGDLFYVGGAGQPVFCFERPDPDDAWGVYHENDPSFVGDAWSNKRGMAWLKGSAARRGLGLLDALPAGDYFLVQSALKVRESKVLLMGNELVERPIWGAELLADPDLRVNVFGAAADSPPSLDQPLLGVPTLNLANRLTGVFFLEMASTATCEDAVGDEADDLVLVIPRTGPLVLNTLEPFGADKHRAAVDAWARNGARQTAYRLARSS